MVTSIYITDRKRAEEALADKEAQLRLALDTMPGGMMLEDHNGNYLLFNSQFSELHDYPEGFFKVGMSARDEARVQVERFLAGAGEMQYAVLAPHLAAKSLTEQLDDVGFVVDHEYGDRHALPPPAGVAASPDCWRGSVMTNSVYRPSFESTVNCPLCCCTTIS